MPNKSFNSFVVEADARNRALYKEFGDALKFDSTYLTNKYDMPFAAFVEFIVREDVGEVSHRLVSFIVLLTEVYCVVNCNCRLCEFKGILCRHAIVVLIHKEIFVIPDKYILRRGRKDVTRCHTKVKIGYDNWSTKLEGHRFDKMYNTFYELAYLATGSDAMCNIVIEGITDLKTKLISNGGDNGSSRYIPTLNNDTSKKNCNILSPRAVRSKGRPPFKRKQSMVEKVVPKRKQNKSKMKSTDPEMTKECEMSNEVCNLVGCYVSWVKNLG
ncbi:hypothetical protein Dsin_012243 [Dipteronia sinensis]|uniref:SWIM-type domain-containing protein n=1 Tax=Dipteronia sinensis TaxID=43782 RepID=A0AAE0E7R9_9ROSI|nr:hypothetical protein Dsin_012243 [Dipteronia sinensis]